MTHHGGATTGHRGTDGAGSQRPSRSNAGAALAVVVGFHPRLATPRPRDAGNITGKVLVCIGTEDPLISIGERLMFEEQMRAAGVDWRMNLYGGAQHSFTHPRSIASDPLSRPGDRHPRRIDGTAEITEDPGPLLEWATRITGRYMGAERAEEYGRRNAVPGELLVRITPNHVVAQANIAD